MAEVVREENALTLRGITKRFGRTQALAGVDFEVRAGEIHGLIGQNGSGKSTLVKILTGVHRMDAGHVEVWGRVVGGGLLQPVQHGIAVVHQDLGLVDGASVLDNLAVGSHFGARLLRPIPTRNLRKRYLQLARDLGLNIDLDRLVSSLGQSDRAIVAIVRAIAMLGDSHERRLLILDEPTATLRPREAAALMETMAKLAGSGVAIIFTSHNLYEVIGACDTVTVLRDGRVTKSGSATGATPTDLATAMLGRPMSAFYPEKHTGHRGDLRVQVKQLSGQEFSDLTFSVGAGEVLGIVGLHGSGQSELLSALAGAVQPQRGVVRVLDANGDWTAPRITQIGLVPGNRLRDGVFAEASARENMTISNLRAYVRFACLSKSSERREANKLVRRLNVHPANANLSLSAFSGGNQQKIIFARALRAGVSTLLMEEPTQGVDAGAKHDLLQEVLNFARCGGSSIVISGDLEQIAETCSRALILQDGRFTAELSGSDLTEGALLNAL